MITERLHLDHSDTPVRAPLIGEANTAMVASLTAPTEQERIYHRGVFVGYLIAFGVESDEQLDIASRTFYAGPFRYDEATAGSSRFRYVRDVDGYLFACGILLGYKQGTSERADADECLTCTRRICTTVDEHERCDHGLFCEGRDCFSDFHDGRQCISHESEPVEDDGRQSFRIVA